MLPSSDMSRRKGSLWRNIACAVLLAVGLFQIAGTLIGSKVLKGFGAATAVSPFPKVFSDVNGLEPFASDFFLRIETESGGILEETITPSFYQRLAGPYNRRNVYGAALSYAPRLPDALWQSVFCYGFRQGGPLWKEFNLPVDTLKVSIIIRTKTRGRSDIWVLQPECSK